MTFQFKVPLIFFYFADNKNPKSVSAKATILKSHGGTVQSFGHSETTGKLSRVFQLWVWINRPHIGNIAWFLFFFFLPIAVVFMNFILILPVYGHLRKLVNNPITFLLINPINSGVKGSKSDAVTKMSQIWIIGMIQNKHLRLIPTPVVR